MKKYINKIIQGDTLDILKKIDDDFGLMVNNGWRKLCFRCNIRHRLITNLNRFEFMPNKSKKTLRKLR